MKAKIDAKRMLVDKEPIVVGSLLALALIIHLYSTNGGLIWTSDSFQYWAASQTFSTDGTLKAVDRGSYTFWPPLFPIILSFFTEGSYYIFHTFSLLTTLFFIYHFFKLYTKRLVSTLSLAVLIFCVYPYLISSFLWSELVFTLLLYAGLYYYSLWIRKKKKQHLLISGILLCLLCMQRNAGIFIIFGLSIFHLFEFLEHKDWNRLLLIASIQLLIVVPNILWNSFQRINNPTEFNFSGESFFLDFFLNLKTVSFELARLFIPATGEINSAILIIIGITFLIVLFCQKPTKLPNTVLICYLFMFLILPEFESGETARFLTPVIPIIILQIIILLKKSYPKIKDRKWKVLLTFILTLFMLYNLARTYQNVSQWHYRSNHHPKSAKIFF